MIVCPEVSKFGLISWVPLHLLTVAAFYSSIGFGMGKFDHGN